MEEEKVESGGKNKTYSSRICPAPGAEMQTQHQWWLRRAEKKMHLVPATSL